MTESKPNNIAALRREYQRAALDPAHLADDAIEQFRHWFDDAVRAAVIEPNAFTLATATPDGRPSARVVLIKDIHDRGISFYTNYESRKARELDANPQACAVFFWPELERQARLTGLIERESAERSDAYFQSRPRDSRIGAWASPQSRPLSDREELELTVKSFDERFPGEDVPRPPHWGGYRLLVDEAEFWQGRASRLHDRFQFRRASDGTWQIERLAP